MRRRLTLLIFFLCSFFGHSKTIEVCAGCAVQSIAEAILLAEEGDEILIHEGLYQEYEIEVNKALHIKGKGYPVVDGQMKGTIFRITSSGVTLEGLKLQNVGQSYTKDFAAILLHEADDFVLKNNVLEHVFFGILVEKSKRGLIAHNRVSGSSKSQASSGNGIHLWHCKEVVIFDNQVRGMRDGIYFEFVERGSVYDNLSIENLRYGLHFMFSNNSAYYANTFENNGAGVAIMFSKFVKMYRNNFVKNWGSASYGLLLKEIYDAEIHDNLFEKNTIAISIDGSTRIDYKRNTFSRNGWAIKIVGACYENDFSENNFLNNALDLSYNSNINSNRFEGNYWSAYTGYDLDKDGKGDVPYRPVKLFSYIVHNTPESIILLRSLFVDIINFSEKVSPVFTPDKLVDAQPLMQQYRD